VKKLIAWLNDLFDLEISNDIPIELVAEALNDQAVRSFWLQQIVSEVKSIHLELDRRLLTGKEENIRDLVIRRKSYQDILQLVLSSKRVVTQGERHNQPSPSFVNLDRLTV
jgi:hypothetical protein